MSAPLMVNGMPTYVGGILQQGPGRVDGSTFYEVGFARAEGGAPVVRYADGSITCHACRKSDCYHVAIVRRDAVAAAPEGSKAP